MRTVADLRAFLNTCDPSMLVVLPCGESNFRLIRQGSAPLKGRLDGCTVFPSYDEEGENFVALDWR